MRVLLVEDDAMIGEAVAQALKDASYAVDWVRDGSMALASISTQEYGVVLLDLGLPKKGGLEVLRTVRSRGNAGTLYLCWSSRRATRYKTGLVDWTAAPTTMY